MTNNNIFGKPATGIAFIAFACAVLIVVNLTLTTLNAKRDEVKKEIPCTFVYGGHLAFDELYAADTQKGIFVTVNSSEQLRSDTMLKFSFEKMVNGEPVYNATGC